jgi:transposase
LSAQGKRESTKPAVTSVGLDGSKDRLDYPLDGVTAASGPNTAAGHARRVKALRRGPAARVVGEARGGYERAVVAQLLTPGLEVCVVPPGRGRAFAHAEGLLAKTDRLDARRRRRDGGKRQPRWAGPTAPAAAERRELLEPRRQRSDDVVATGHRLGRAGAPLRPRRERQQAFLREELAAVDRLIEQHIAGANSRAADRCSRPPCWPTARNSASSPRRSWPP